MGKVREAIREAGRRERKIEEGRNVHIRGSKEVNNGLL